MPPPEPGPPALSVNGVAGVPANYCWLNTCGQSSDDLLSLPEIRAPIEVVLLPADAEIAAVLAIRVDDDGSEEVTEVPFDGATFGALPRDATRLSIFLRFENGGEATYLWSLIGG